jgi:hypothetical protein
VFFLSNRDEVSDSGLSRKTRDLTNQDNKKPSEPSPSACWLLSESSLECKVIFDENPFDITDTNEKIDFNHNKNHNDVAHVNAYDDDY